MRTGSLVASFAILFFPVTFLGMYSPFAIRLLLRNPAHSGRVSGTVYGVNTFGSIVGTLGTTFYLIPLMGSRAITIALGIAGIAGRPCAGCRATGWCARVPARTDRGRAGSGSVVARAGTAPARTWST